MNIEKLKEVLESKKFEDILDMNDMLIGDEGCSTLCDFLMNYSDFK